ncbi:hypothetical protein GSI_04789 [Ganoderma sinense ZZ0214-1]|uniref:Uncharacterized protein n=1 Tax=Ganoderma sinense ZZ0214-1 TaxID=1077348 RepID=A0A2G8SIF3_9APHY|nr:hypothetical protein GSI_04789 [Ganoderma sinense ZZ0214-1]
MLGMLERLRPVEHPDKFIKSLPLDADARIFGPPSLGKTSCDAMAVAYNTRPVLILSDMLGMPSEPPNAFEAAQSLCGTGSPTAWQKSRRDAVWPRTDGITMGATADGHLRECERPPSMYRVGSDRYRQ